LDAAGTLDLFGEIISTDELGPVGFAVYRPSVDEIKQKLEKNFTLEDLNGRVFKGRSVEYSEDGEVPIVRSGDLIDIDDDARFLRAFSSEPIVYLRRGNVLISSIGFGSIASARSTVSLHNVQLSTC
jgi:hypothetical protein